MGRVSQKIDNQIYNEVERLSEDYGYAAGTMLDILLAWVTADPSRSDAAVDLRRAQGTERTRKRRAATVATTLRVVSSNEPEPQP